MISRVRPLLARRAPWLPASIAGGLVCAACGSDESARDGLEISASSSDTNSGGASGDGGAAAGGSEATSTGTTTSATAGAGTSGVGGGGGGGGSDYVACVGCGEYLTTSDPMAVLCAGSAPLWEKWTSCACVACAQSCGAMCEAAPNPACTTCRIEVAYGACAAHYQACAKDL